MLTLRIVFCMQQRCRGIKRKLCTFSLLNDVVTGVRIDPYCAARKKKKRGLMLVTIISTTAGDHYCQC